MDLASDVVDAVLGAPVDLDRGEREPIDQPRLVIVARREMVAEPDLAFRPRGLHVFRQDDAARVPSFRALRRDARFPSGVFGPPPRFFVGVGVEVVGSDPSGESLRGSCKSRSMSLMIAASTLGDLRMRGKAAPAFVLGYRRDMEKIFRIS